MAQFTMRVFRGDASGGGFKDYKVEPEEGMVVLDVIHKIQATQANDLACRWNCKAGKCGSCSAEVCPEHIHITDNGIIPLKERAADALDPIVWLLKKFRGQKSRQA